MAYNFKSIADVEVVAEPAESANVLIEENGVIKKAPKTAVGGGGIGYDFVIRPDPDDWRVGDLFVGAYKDLYNKHLNNEFIVGFFWDPNEMWNSIYICCAIYPEERDGKQCFTVWFTNYSNVAHIYEDDTVSFQSTD